LKFSVPKRKRKKPPILSAGNEAKMSIDFFKVWIVPPVVGAIIGYFTNWLAIKMLFRPLKPVYIGKIKLPFTPGILPRERIHLTESVGDTVATELLTPDVFKSRLQEPALKGKIEASLFGILKAFFSKSAAPFLRGLLGEKADQGTANPSDALIAPKEGSASMEPGLWALLSSSLGNIVGAAEFRAALAAAVVKTAEDAGKMPARALLAPARVGEIARKAIERCAEDDASALIDAFIDSILGTSTNNVASGSAESAADATAKELAREPLFQEAAILPLADAAARALYLNLIPLTETLLKTPEIHASLESLAMDIVRKAIQRLGPIQRLIVTAANYEKTLQASMPETIEDLASAVEKLLKSPEMENRIAASALAYVRTARLSKTPEGEIGLSADGYGWIVERQVERGAETAPFFPAGALKSALRAFLAGIEADKAGFAARVEERYAAIADKPLAALFPAIWEPLVKGIADGISRGSGKLANFGSSSPAASGLLANALAEFLRAYALQVEGASLGEMLGWDDESLMKIARSLAELVAQALGEHAERLVEALDVRAMVVERISELDMADVERIILQVVDKELNWITILGGVLGGLIGIVQSLFSLI
jgi:hypothetical protein